MIEIIKAPAHLVLQDAGFFGTRKIGLPRAGAMDLRALRFGNSLVGNSADEVAFEWALTGGEITFRSDVVIALAGATVHGRIGNRSLVMNKRIEAPAGTTLEVDRFSEGRFLYLCVSPAPLLEPFLGSRSTYVPARIGGYEGRRLKAGDKISLENHPATIAPECTDPSALGVSTFRVVPGPQSDALDGRLLEYLLHSQFTISISSDRTGYRLDGPPVDVSGLGQILSEPACEGAIQITDSGLPIVLMADGPTIGGYNKIAVLAADDISPFAQKSPGEKVRFALTAG